MTICQDRVGTTTINLVVHQTREGPTMDFGAPWLVASVTIIGSVRCEHVLRRLHRSDDHIFGSSRMRVPTETNELVFSQFCSNVCPEPVLTKASFFTIKRHSCN